MILENRVKRAVKLIDEKHYRPLSIALLDIVLASLNPHMIPDEVAEKIVRLFKEDRLSTREGIEALLTASMLCEPDRLIKFLKKETKLDDVARMLEEG